jgi:hypothetical protein
MKMKEVMHRLGCTYSASPPAAAAAVSVVLASVAAIGVGAVAAEVVGVALRAVAQSDL